MEDALAAHKESLKELSVEETHKLDPEVERRANEHVRELLEATREPIALSKYKEPVMYYEPAEGTGGLPAVICTCGKYKKHLRMKVLQQWSEKHYLKTGHKPVERA